MLNHEAVNLAIRAGIALNAEIAKTSSFDRKHYFYPDLPKGYQITQLERPTVGNGEIDVPLQDGSFKVRITRAHIEEDAGKLTHPEGADYSLVDLNRAGTPLIEIVSEADMHSAEQAKAYVQELYLLMKSAGVTDGDLYNGNMRFDVNISIAPKGSDQLGTRAEIKNLNSFRSVERAAQYEYERQAELLERGERIVQETRGWNDAKQRTFSQRSKEEAMDYRYFPDADLPPIELNDERIQQMREKVEPRHPGVLRAKMQAAGIRQADAETMLLADAVNGTKYVATVLLANSDHGKDEATFATNFIINRVIGKEGAMLPTALHFADVFAMFTDKRLSSNNVDALLLKLANDTNSIAAEVAEAEGLLQDNDEGTITAVIDEVMSDPASVKAIADIRGGNERAIGYLVGQVMKKSGGKINPAVASQLIRERL